MLFWIAIFGGISAAHAAAVSAAGTEPCAVVQQTRTRLLAAQKPQPAQFPLCAETQNAALRQAGVPGNLTNIDLRLALLDLGVINPRDGEEFYPQFLKDLATSADGAATVAYLNSIRFYASSWADDSPDHTEIIPSEGLFVLADAAKAWAQAPNSASTITYLARARAANDARVQAKQRAVYDQSFATVDPTQMPLDANGLLRQSPLAFSPEAEWYPILRDASALRSWDPALAGFTAAEQARIAALADAFDRTRADLYSGENAYAATIPFVRSVQPTTSTVDAQIHEEDPDSAAGGLAGEGFWWMNSSGLTKISGATSLSPLGQEFGLDYYRIGFWPIAGPLLAATTPEQPFPELDQIRVSGISPSESYQSQNYAAVEVLAHDDDGVWHAFVYQRVWGRWFPAKTFGHAQKPVRQACLQCHVAAGTTDQMTPMPDNLHGPADFRKVGYVDDRLISALLDPANQ